MAGGIFGGEDNPYWIAGYQDAEGNYYNLQEESRAVDYGDEVTVDWERAERWESKYGDAIRDELIEADYAVIGWIDADGVVNYATLPDGIDLDEFDFEDWVEDYG